MVVCDVLKLQFVWSILAHSCYFILCFCFCHYLCFICSNILEFSHFKLTFYLLIEGATFRKKRCKNCASLLVSNNLINPSTLCIFVSRCHPLAIRLAVWSAHKVPGQISYTCLIQWTLSQGWSAQSCMKHNPLSLTDTLDLQKSVGQGVHRCVQLSVSTEGWWIKTQESLVIEMDRIRETETDTDICLWKMWW